MTAVKIKEVEVTHEVDMSKNAIIVMGSNEYPVELAETAEVKVEYCSSCGAYHPGDGYTFTTAEMIGPIENLLKEEDENIARQTTIKAIIKLKAHLARRGWPVG